MKPGYIPASDAIVLWDDSGAKEAAITEVVVCDQHTQPQWGRRLINSRGACDMKWLDGSWIESPIGIFLMMAVTDGFSSKEIKVLALREFGKIVGQEEWTRGLLRYLGENVDDDN